MKQVFIIIRPNMYYKTKEELVKKGFFSMSVKDVLGRGKDPAELVGADSGEALPDIVLHPFIAKKMIEIFCRDEDLEDLIGTIKAVNQTNNKGDGKIIVVNIDESVRIRTGEKNDNALV